MFNPRGIYPEESLFRRYCMNNQLLGIILFGLFFFSCSSNDPVIPANEDPADPFVQWPSLSPSPWPMYAHDPQLTGRSHLSGPTEGAIEWKYETGFGNNNPPVIDEAGNIYFGSDDGTFYSLGKEGTLRWKYVVTGGIISALISSAGKVFVAAGGYASPKLYAFTTSGTKEWDIPLPAKPSRSGLTISKDGSKLFVSFLEDSVAVLAVNVKGYEEWRYVTTGKHAVQGIAQSPDGTKLYFQVWKEGLYCIDTSGSFLWKNSSTETDAYFSLPVVSSSGDIFVLVSRTGLHCISSDGTVRWVYPHQFSKGNNLAIGNNAVIYAIMTDTLVSEHLFAISTTGNFLWKTNIGRSNFADPIVDKNNTVYVSVPPQRNPPSGGTANDSCNLFAVKENGEIINRLTMRSSTGKIHVIEMKPAIGFNQRMFVGTRGEGMNGEMVSLK